MAGGEDRLDARIHGELDRCVRCGNCMAVCPVYEVMGREGGAARGKISLFRAHLDGLIGDDDPAYRELLTSCLLCGRCRTACPNEVDTPAIVQAARVRLARRGRLGRIKSFVLNKVLPRQGWLVFLGRMARLGRWTWAARLPSDSGLRVRYLRGPKGERRRLPQLAAAPFIEAGVGRDAGDGPRVAFFVGCVHNFMKPQAAQAAVDLLRDAGARLHIPAAQGCCGLPAWGAGMEAGARELARRNLEALWPAGEDIPEFVTSACASCAYMLHKHLPELLADDPDLGPRAKILAERVLPFSILWARLAGVDREGEGRMTVSDERLLTYHDPCHLSRGFGEKGAPRFLLTRLNGVRFVEMSHPCRCCGHGGSFNLAHYDLSLRMAEDKARRIMESGARYLATECSGCLLQLEEALARRGAEIEVLSTAEAAQRFGLNIDKAEAGPYAPGALKNFTCTRGCDGDNEKDGEEGHQEGGQEGQEGQEGGQEGGEASRQEDQQKAGQQGDEEAG